MPIAYKMASIKVLCTKGIVSIATDPKTLITKVLSILFLAKLFFYVQYFKQKMKTKPYKRFEKPYLTL